MNKNQFEVDYEHLIDEKSLEDVFGYIFDEIRKVINSKHANEQQISINEATV